MQEDAIQKLLKKRYYLKNENTWDDIAKRISAIYPPIYEYIKNKDFIPSSPTLMNANTNGERIGTLSSCFTMGIEDSIEGIFDSVKEAAIVTKASGGVGYVFSKLRGSGEIIKSIGRESSGPLPFAKIFDTMLDGVSQGGVRRGAGMMQFDIDHPDILEIIRAKNKPGILERMNISIRISDNFYTQLKNNPNEAHIVFLKDGSSICLRENGKLITVQEIWDEIIKYAWLNAEPGIFNSDIATRQCTVTNISNAVLSNPCQEYVNIEYSSCNLGSINLCNCVIDGVFDWDKFEDLIVAATRFLNEVIDSNFYPLEKIEKITKQIRPIGLGVFGYSHMLYELKIPYNSKEAYSLTEDIFDFLTYMSMITSVRIAQEKRNSYPAFDYHTYIKANSRFFNKSEAWDALKDSIKDYGIYNSCNTSIAPTGSISYIANRSSSIEPVFALAFSRKIEEKNKEYDVVELADPIFTDYLYKNYTKEDIDTILKYISNNDGSCQGCSLIPEDDQKVFVVAGDLTAMEHLKTLGIIARNTSLSVSKTINLPETATAEEISNVYINAFKEGVIGVTVYRKGSREAILNVSSSSEVKEPVIDKVSSITPRDRVLDGKTYKIKDPHGNVYVTCNYAIVNGKKKPMEVFIFSSNENQEMYAALGKTLSAIMRRNDDISFIIEDLKSIKSSTESGGYFTQEYGFIKSRPQHLSYILDEFISRLEQESDSTDTLVNEPKYKPTEEVCPDCGANLVRQGGCCQCSSCSWSRCG